MKRPTWKYLRPFPNAHWTLAVGALLAFAVVLAASDGCGHRADALVASLLTALVFVCLWLADLRRGERGGWRRVAWVGWQAMGDLVVFCFVLLWPTLLLLLLQGSMNCMDNRAYTAEVVQSSVDARNDIAARAVARGSLKGAGSGVALPAFPDTQAFGLVTPDGTILWAVPESGAVLILTPTLADGAVTWRCQGRPERAVPAGCRLG